MVSHHSARYSRPEYLLHNDQVITSIQLATTFMLIGDPNGSLGASARDITDVQRIGNVYLAIHNPVEEYLARFLV